MADDGRKRRGRYKEYMRHHNPYKFKSARRRSGRVNLLKADKNPCPTICQSGKTPQEFLKAVPGSVQHNTAGDFDPADTINGIRQLYKVREGWLCPFPSCEDFHVFHIDSMFTRLKVNRTETRGTRTDNINMSEIFKPHEECPHPRTVLIEGTPGMGKTTYCKKIVYDWATGKQEAEDGLPRFEIVLLLQCRDIKSDLWETIDDQILPVGVGEDVRERFFDYIRQNQSNVLLILDGLDDVPPSKLPVFTEIIQGRKELPKCHVIATAQLEAGMKVRRYFDTRLEIEGFIEEDARKFIFKYFSDINLAKVLMSEVRRDKNLRDMVANPLNTLLLCVIFEDYRGIFPESRGQLYEEIIRCILRRYRAKKGLPETSKDLIEVYGAQLKHLGRIALNGLLEDYRDFEESELKSHADELPEFGFLSVQAGGSKLRPRRHYSFRHKSFQEFFAAFYLCSQLLNEEISVDSIVTNRRYFHGLNEVILFLFGMLAARKREATIALVKTATTKLNQKVKTDGVGILCVLQGCIKECSKDQRKLVTEMADIFGSVLKPESPSRASLAESLKQWMEGKDNIEGGYKPNVFLVPPEIVVRGRLALEAYHKALAEGKTFVKRVPVMLIGQDRSGKTSLKKSLRGELFNPDEENTVGIDIDPSHLELSTEIWTMPEKDQEPISGTSISYEHHVARATVKHMMQTRRAHISEEKTLKVMPSENVPAVETVSASTTISSHIPAEVGAVSFSSQEIQENRSDGTSNDPNGLQMMSNESVQTSRHAENEDSKPYIPNDVQTAMIKFLENDIKVEDEEVHAVLWDFAGQSVYFPTHPIFLTPRAIYLLAYDLSKNPYERARLFPRQGLFQKFAGSCGLEFNSDYLDFWMSSVASLASQEETDQVSSESQVLSDKLPVVFLVCTHADTPYDSLRDPKTLANELYRSLQNKPYKRHLRNLFVVDNTKSGRGSECPGVKHLRKELQTVAKQLPQMKEPIPIRWLNYEKKLQAKKKLKEWIDLHEAKRIASEECNIVDDEEFRTVLNFLHDNRILIHFSDTPALDKLVVLDPQWLVDVFKKVMTIPPYDSKEKDFKQLWTKLQGTGILEERLLHHVWETLLFDKETTENLLEIMEKFSLLCSWPSSDASCGKQYLMPSMLASYPPEDIMSLLEAASAQIPPLFVKFESGVVPPGLFPRLVLLFLQWGKENRLNPVEPLLYHNFARCFISEDASQSVVLLCLSSSIEVAVHRENDIQESEAECLQSMTSGSVDVFAGSVCRQLELILESMRKEFCWLKNMRWKLSFICPVCCQGGVNCYCDAHQVEGCKKEECLHFLSLSELCNKKVIVCNKSAGALFTKVDVRQFVPWFTSPGYQLTGDEHNEETLANLAERKEIALPGELQKSLLSQSCGAKDVVVHLKETMQLDQASLEKPDLETRTLIHRFAREAKESNRLDVVQHLRKITPAGTTGPLLPEQLNVRDIPVSKRKDLTINLIGGEEWKEVAERLGLTPREIRFLDSRTLNPFDAALAFIARQRNITVADLYELLNECGYPVIADLL